MRYLLDTAPWINAVLMPEALPKRILDIAGSNDHMGLCSVSLLEVAILYRLKRLELTASLSRFFEVALAENLTLLEITPAIAVKTNQLTEDFHGDPFDRTIVATAAINDLILITADPAIRDARQCAVEYYPFKPMRSKNA